MNEFISFLPFRHIDQCFEDAILVLFVHREMPVQLPELESDVSPKFQVLHDLQEKHRVISPGIHSQLGVTQAIKFAFLRKNVSYSMA